MEVLKGKRTYIKGQITRIENYVRVIKDDASVDELAVRLERIQKLYKDFVEVEYQMLELSDIVETDIEAVDTQYYSIIPKLQGAIRKRAPTNQPAVLLDQSLNNTNAHSSDFRLPRITIPPFDGNFKEWQSFFDLFGSAVHENANLSPAQKFQLLIGHLRGEALALVRHLQINDANYIEAYQKLCKRYDKKKYIVDSFIQSFFDQPTVTHATSQSLARLQDTCDEVIRGLKALGTEAESRDPWLIYIATQKMDSETRQMWKLETSEINYPTFDNLLSVLNKRMDVLQGMKTESAKRTLSKPHVQQTKSMHTASAVNCAFCGKDHKLFECEGFLGLEIQQRRDYVKKHSRCYNCLSDTHMVYQCKSKRKCSKCQRKHHAILHLELESSTQSPEKTTCGHANSIDGNAILLTAQIALERYNGEWQICRALLDSGSQTSFVTEECFQRLGIKRTKARMFIQGLNNTNSGVSKGVATIRIRSRFEEANYETNARVFIVPKISSYQPSINKLEGLQELTKIKLADPNFQKKSKIDVLLGSDLFFDLISDGKKYITNSQLVAHNTKIGWIIAGVPLDRGTQKDTSINLHLDVDHTLRKFWEIEEVVSAEQYSDEERFCLNFYQKTFQRAPDGRYIVSLPFKLDAPKLGQSKFMAVKRFANLERRFLRDQSFKEQYIQFLDEYRKLGHMELSTSDATESYYLPHHGVLRENSATTKLRVVFDGSAKTTYGNSLNEQLAVGPVVQSSLVEILLRFRKHKVIFTADIEKMFRQIWVSKTDSDYQRIVWRKDAQNELQVFKLLTVTYGTSCAPFLATQTLVQLASDYQQEYPEAAEILKHDFYVDDLLSGTSNVKDAQKLVMSLGSLLNKGGFNLRKWSTNYPEILHNIPEENRDASVIDLTDDSSLTVLGVRYSPINDSFQFKVSLEDITLTKRNMLSEASKLFDPIGWLSPTIIKIKILFQKLWLLGIGWDDLLPDAVCSSYSAIRRNLVKLEDIHIKRWLYTDGEELELHGFADASELAYAAVIYSRVRTKSGYKTNLVTAKTKVAPIKTVSIPRLELCAVTLLTKLMASVVQTFKKSMNVIVWLWTDSTIVLSWISSCPRRWQTYVANRVSYVLEHSDRRQWRHVSSSDNPADCASRGLFPEELVNHSLWFSGPPWLSRPEGEWPKQNQFTGELPEEAIKEQKMNSIALVTTTGNSNDWLDDLLERCSSFTKVLFVIARILILFRSRASRKAAADIELSRNFNRAKFDAFNLVIRRIQLNNFADEINSINKNKQINSNSKLISLFPFIDRYGLLRVGGRLDNADMSYEMKHPVILPSKNRLTTLIIRDEHLRLLHAGPTLLVSTLKQKYNILRCKVEVRGVIGRCVKCIRFKKQQQQQLMGQLPQSRVTFQKPFYTTGVDYAGPLLIKASKLRGAKSIKAYLALFVCMATKAVHLELVSDMTTEAFLAVLRRFHARRGICGHIYSDNGSNFIGAQREIQRSLLMVSKDEALLRYIHTNNIKWHFIPPGAPNFGGLWEAGIKSCKYHLKRVLGETLLTFEELTTLLTQIEAIMNSRPLCEISPEELDPLTPGHFLIGHAITLLPEPNLLDIKANRLSRWQHIQRMVQHFWQRWNKEYLVTLQQRQKWKLTSTNPKIDDLVVIFDEDAPPAKWLMGRIIETIPGQDGLVRVVRIKTKLGEIKRPITKISTLLYSGSVEPTGAGCSG